MKDFWTEHAAGGNQLSRKARKRVLRSLLRKRFANLMVDLGNSCQMGLSIVNDMGGAGTASPLSPQGSGTQVCNLSGTIIGQTVDMLNSDTYCNLFAAGLSLSGGGQLRLQVQVADADVSGQFTDPTSGFVAGAFPNNYTVGYGLQAPGGFSSGGVLFINSGGGTPATFTGAGGTAGGSGSFLLSGFVGAAGFIRNGRYARVNLLVETVASGWGGTLVAGFIAQQRTTGLSGGTTQSPGSGAISV